MLVVGISRDSTLMRRLACHSLVSRPAADPHRILRQHVGGMLTIQGTESVSTSHIYPKVSLQPLMENPYLLSKGLDRSFGRPIGSKSPRPSSQGWRVPPCDV